jgi:hypothetical protein
MIRPKLLNLAAVFIMSAGLVLCTVAPYEGGAYEWQPVVGVCLILLGCPVALLAARNRRVDEL